MTDVKPEWIEKAAKALADDWNPDRDPVLTAMFRDYAHTALVAVADNLRAEGWDEGYLSGVHDDASSRDWTDGAHPPNRANPYRKDSLS